MKIVMLGWEFPPYYAGGVGIVCYELTKVLSQYDNVEIDYILPYGPEGKKLTENLTLRGANSGKKRKVSIRNVPGNFSIYESTDSYLKRFENLLNNPDNKNSKSIKELYGGDLIEEVFLYAQRIANLLKDEDFDVIHAHDWTTIPAALLLKELTGKPVILHVHITELNKTGGQGGHQKVFEIEQLGFQKADKLIAVSGMIKNMLIEKYLVDGRKIEVVHNGGVSDIEKNLFPMCNSLKSHANIVLYAGRITLQKGPEYFLQAAKKVLEYEPNTLFIMAGTGEMLTQMIELAADLGISSKVLFHGFYTRKEADDFYSMADVFVMPSVLEPFGIVPLEAIAKGTPTVISKQSGISEVLENCFKIDFWDIDEMASKILSLIKYPHLKEHMKDLAFKEYDNFNWGSRADKVVNIYQGVIKND